MKITEILTEKNIYLNYTAKDKWVLIENLVNGFVANGNLKKEHIKAVQNALVVRENISSTGMENGVALPHAQVDNIDDALCALAISTLGIPFQSQDDKPAKIIALLVVPKIKIQIHIKTLAAIAGIMSSKKIRESLLSAKTAEEVIKILKSTEQKA